MPRYGEGAFTPYNGGGRGGERDFRPARYERKEVVKHSGAGMKVLEDGRIAVYGWKWNKSHGMVKFYARPYKNTSEGETKNGRKWITLFGTLVFRDRGNIQNVSIVADKETGKCVIKEFGWVVNPKARAGGYMGPWTHGKGQ